MAAGDKRAELPREQGRVVTGQPPLPRQTLQPEDQRRGHVAAFQQDLPRQFREAAGLENHEAEESIGGGIGSRFGNRDGKVGEHVDRIAPLCRDRSEAVRRDAAGIAADRAKQGRLVG